jgi:catechol 2,3-dioxygenase-like lactoylglutathione lyase family enzyme
MAGIHATVPVLASLDLAESRQFYTELLGFDCLHASADYLMLRRDGCELHLWHCTERHIAENTSCYVRGDTAALHADLRNAACWYPRSARGMRSSIDPHGNLLKFGPAEPN